MSCPVSINRMAGSRIAANNKHFTSGGRVRKTSVRASWFLTVLVGLSALLAPVMSAQAADTLALVGLVNFSSANGSECWGWTAPDGTEYAIMGYHSGIAFVRTTPSVALIDTVPGPTGSGGYIWREMKTYRHYAYSVSEATGTYQGITVTDLQYLPDSVHYIGSFTTNGDSTGFTAHTISIDTATGYCYVEGISTQKVRILSLANPEHPLFVKSFGTSAGEIHDMTAFNDTVYVAEGTPGTWSVWDLTNKAAPTMIVRITSPSLGYLHNVWISPDHQYCATTEETVGRTVKFWNISDLQNVQLVGNYLGPSGMAHNAHWKTQDTLILSHYQSGVVILDVSNPALPVQIARYDTYPLGETSAYAGCWGAYPFTQNGYIYGSDIEGDLNVLELRPVCATLGAPALLLPADGATDVAQPLTLSWSANGATGYRVEVDDDPGFGSPYVTAVVTDTTLNVSGLAMMTTYRWRVRSQNVCGDGAPSPVRTFDTECEIAMTGDVNVTGHITSADIVYLVNFVFKSGAAPQPIEAAGDVDCSGAVTAADVILLVNFTFKSGPPPCNVCTIL
jgi:choice-of-anchor B domain-containing protein